MDITVKQFEPGEWPAFKKIRLKALQTDPLVYSSTYDTTIKEPDSYWQDRLKNPLQAIFGIFAGKNLIGMTGVYIRDEDPDNAWLGSSWLEKEWRNKGLSKMLYTPRLRWAQQQPGLKAVFVAHRQGNVPSMKAILKHGFRLERTHDETWPDGKTEPELTYKLEL